MGITLSRGTWNEAGESLGYRKTRAERLPVTGRESRLLNVGHRVIWHGDSKDAGTVIERNWAGVTIRWDNNREQQKFLHNDIAMVAKV